MKPAIYVPLIVYITVPTIVFSIALLFAPHYCRMAKENQKWQEAAISEVVAHPPTTMKAYVDYMNRIAFIQRKYDSNMSNCHPLMLFNNNRPYIIPVN